MAMFQGVSFYRVIINALFISFVTLNALFGYNLQLRLGRVTQRPSLSSRIVEVVEHFTAELTEEMESSGMLWEAESEEAVSESEEDEQQASPLTEAAPTEDLSGPQDSTAKVTSKAAMAMEEARRKADKRAMARETAQQKLVERQKEKEQAKALHDARYAQAREAMTTAKDKVQAIKEANQMRVKPVPAPQQAHVNAQAAQVVPGKVPVRVLEDPRHFNCSLPPPPPPPSPPPPPPSPPPAPEAAKQGLWGTLFGGKTSAPTIAPPDSDSDAEESPPPEAAGREQTDVCWEGLVHVALSLESHYLRGAVALINSILSNAACPQAIFFHFPVLAADREPATSALLQYLPHIQYATYDIDGYNLQKSVRKMSYRGGDLESPLNYARIYLPQMLPSCVKKCIYLDTDMVVLDRIEKMWNTNLGKFIIASPEFCEFKFHRYFTDYFWGNHSLSDQYKTKREACYFNPGVMLFHTERWRRGDITKKLLYWMDVQKEGKERIYKLGSLPPFLLVFSGNLKSIDRGWNIHDLGCGCNVKVDPKTAMLLHWSCAGKPWRRLEGEQGKPCSSDKLYWLPYDLVGAAKRKALEHPVGELAPTNGAPTNGAPTNGAPTNGAPTNGAPTNGAPTNGAPTNGAPSDEPLATLPPGSPTKESMNDLVTSPAHH